MTALAMLALAVAVAAFAFSSVVIVWMLVLDRLERRTELERERVAAQQERMAAQNGRPHTDPILVTPRRRS